MMLATLILSKLHFVFESIFLLKSCGAYAESVSGEADKWRKLIDDEREQRQRMENMVEDLAKQHRHLEYQISSSVQNQLKMNIGPIQETPGLL